jgi:vitamin K-dependent gamma-carboxylase
MSLRDRLVEPIDGASLRAFRFLFGVLLIGFLARTTQKGVIEHGFVEPVVFFHYFGLALPSPGRWAYLLYGVLALCAACFALGRWPRVCAGLFCVGFSYLHLVDVTHYLNHYYLVTLLTGLLALVPIGASAPRWGLWLLRFQVGVVYFFGGVAKLKHDWLVMGEPLRTWLAASTDVLGSLCASREAALAMSWLGAVYDLSIPFLLLGRRTRPLAYVAVLAFHGLTARLFQIGLFPWMMMVASLLFLAPDWPRRFVPLAAFTPARYTLPRWVPLYLAWQLLVPLRHWLYPGNVLWSEQGYRWSWNVMLMEKTGSAEFRVVEPGKQRTVFPRQILTRAQDKMMATQPDLILQFAHTLARQAPHARVYADVWVSLNGRRAARLIDPTVDLAREQDTLANKRWILPAPE